jgi:hypothetical protein
MLAKQCCGSREAGDLIGIEGHDFSVGQYGLPDENDRNPWTAPTWSKNLID